MSTNPAAPRPEITLWIAGLAALAIYLDTTILFVAFPEIGATFDGESPSVLSWVLNGYTIVFAALLVPGGKAGDRFGHRQAFLAGSVVFTIASMMCGWAQTVEWLIAARVGQGVGAALLIPASLALVMAAFANEQLPRVIAIWGAIGAASAALGPSAGALLIESMGWRWAFYVNLPIGVATLIAGMKFIAPSPPTGVRLPALSGVVLVAAAAGLVSYAIVDSDRSGWLSGQTLGLFVAGGVLLAGFVVHQQRTVAPTLDLELFSHPNFTWGNIGMFVYSTSFSAMFLGLILFQVEVWDRSVLEAGLGVAPGAALAAVIASRLGRLAMRIGQRPMVLAGAALFTTGAVLRVVMLGESPSYWTSFAPSFFIACLSIAMVFPQTTSAAAQSLPADRRGVGGAVTQAVRQFGGSLGVAITLGLIGTGAGLELAGGFDRLWWFLVAGGAVTGLAALPLQRR